MSDRSCSSELENDLENINDHQTRCYKKEFQEICVLDKLGGGNVFKAKYNFDGVEYAVKKIPFKLGNIKGKKPHISDVECPKKFLREVKSHANLQQKNIVSYKTAWMEYDSDKESSSSESSESQTSSNFSDGVQENKMTDNAFQSDGKENTSDEKYTSDETSKSDEMNKLDMEEQQQKPPPSGSQGSDDFCKIILYIQMELCDQTLEEWIFERNGKFRPEGFDDEEWYSNNIKIFKQILKGVKYIHDLGLIHRDLKPSNIFISNNDLCIKIGDFGLATGDFMRPGREDLVLLTKFDRGEDSDKHTKGPGSKLYVSPEQLNSHEYTYKSDMYSLGVILYEMFSLFTTKSESFKEIEQLRKETNCCSAFQKKWPLQAEIIEKLVNHKPNERPSAQDVLDSQLFISLEQQIKELQFIVGELQKQKAELQKQKAESNSKSSDEIMKLQEKLKQKENELQDLQKLEDRDSQLVQMATVQEQGKIQEASTYLYNVEGFRFKSKTHHSS